MIQNSLTTHTRERKLSECEITDLAGHPVIVMRQGELEDRSGRGYCCSPFRSICEAPPGDASPWVARSSRVGLLFDQWRAIVGRAPLQSRVGTVAPKGAEGGRPAPQAPQHSTHVGHVRTRSGEGRTLGRGSTRARRPSSYPSRLFTCTEERRARSFVRRIRPQTALYGPY